MKKQLLTLAISFIAFLGMAQDYSIPLDIDHWTTTHTGPLTEITSGLRCYSTGYRNGNALLSKEVFDLRDKDIYIRWQKDNKGSFLRGYLGVYNTEAFLRFSRNSSYGTSFPNATPLFTRIHIDSSNKEVVIVTCTGNYDNAGGTVQETLNKVISDNNWKNVLNGNVYIRFNDTQNAGATMDIEEVIISNSAPIIRETQKLYDFSDGTIPADFTTAGSWIIDNAESPNGNSMYIAGNTDNYVSFDVTNAVAVKLRYKCSYPGGDSSPTSETVTGLYIYKNGAGSGELNVYYAGRTSYAGDWREIILPADASGTVTFKLQFTRDSGRKFWLDEVRVLKSKSSNAAPTDISLSNSAINENSAIGSVVGNISVTDADANDMHFLELVSGTGSDDNSYFRINGNDLILKQSPDYETKTTLRLRVRATDENLKYAEKSFTINVNDVNEAPEIAASQVFGVDENSAEGTVVGTVSASDVDAGTNLTYSITSGNGEGLFAINSSNGEITVAASGLDYETAVQYSLGVEVSDGSLSDSGTVTVNVSDVNETPEIATGQVFNVDENSPNGTLIGTVSASDVDAGSSLSYSIISGDDEGVFTINSSTGKITFEPPQDCIENPETGEMDCNNEINLDYESTPQYVLQVRVSDNGSLSDTAAVTIDLNNLNDNSPNSFDVAYIYIDEGATDGTVAYTVNMSDPDGDLTPLTFTVTSGHPAFEYENNVIKVKDGSLLDYEKETQFEIKGYVSDGQSKRYGTLPFYINNINDNAPVIESAEITIDEGTANGTVIYTLVYSDADGDLNPLTFTPTSGHDALDLSGDDIVVVDESKLDYETDQTITLTGTISDGTYSDNATLTIHLNNINDNTPVMSNVNAETAERSANGTVVATFDGTDADGTLNALTYSFVSGQNHPAFTISGNQLVVSDGALLDHETEPTINMQVEISDGTNSSTADVVVTVTDIADDAPIITVQPQSVEVCEAEPASLSITAEGDGTLSYEWLKDGVSMGKPDYSTLTLTSDEIDENSEYSCKVTNEFGDAISSSASVTVRALPVVDLGEDKTITTNESVLLDAGAGFTTYMWSDDSDGQTLLFSGSDYGVGVHNVAVRVYDDFGCTVVDEVNVDVTVATAIKKTVTSEINVYPNPATSGYIYVKSSAVNQPVTIELISVSGQVVKIFRNVDVSFIQKLEIGDVIKGMYLIHIFNDDYREAKRLIIR